MLLLVNDCYRVRSRVVVVRCVGRFAAGVGAIDGGWPVMLVVLVDGCMGDLGMEFVAVGFVISCWLMGEGGER